MNSALAKLIRFMEKDKMIDTQLAKGAWDNALKDTIAKQRTFRETINDQILFHNNKIKELQDVLDSLTPDVEKFIEALQKANL